MAFTVPATSTANATAAGTTGITITKPTGLQDDDILYVAIGRDYSKQAFTCSGWTLLDEAETTGGRDFGSYILRKVISDASSEPASYTFVTIDTGSRDMAAVMLIVRGGDTSTPEDATTTSSDGTNDDTPDSPTIITNTDGALVLPICLLVHNTSITIVTPTSFTLADSENYEGGVSVNVGIAYATQASAGASGTNNWPNTGGSGGAEWHTYTVAVKPGAGGAPSLSIPVAMRYYRNMRT